MASERKQIELTESFLFFFVTTGVKEMTEDFFYLEDLRGPHGGQLYYELGKGRLFHRTSAKTKRGKLYKCCTLEAFAWIGKKVPAPTNKSKLESKCRGCVGEDNHWDHPPFTLDDLRLLYVRHSVRLRCVLLSTEHVSNKTLVRWLESCYEWHFKSPIDDDARQLLAALRNRMRSTIKECMKQENKDRDRVLFSNGCGGVLKIDCNQVYTESEKDLAKLETFAKKYEAVLWENSLQLFSSVANPASLNTEKVNETPAVRQYFEREVKLVETRKSAAKSKTPVLGPRRRLFGKTQINE